MAEVSEDELRLIVEALDDAAIYRDARSRVLDSAIRRQERRGASRPASGGTEAHRDKALEYHALAQKLRGLAS